MVLGGGQGGQRASRKESGGGQEFGNSTTAESKKLETIMPVDEAMSYVDLNIFLLIRKIFALYLFSDFFRLPDFFGPFFIRIN